MAARLNQPEDGQMLKIAIFDGSTLFRQGLIQVLPSDFVAVGEARSADEGVAKLMQGLSPDIILVDAAPDRAGDAIRALKEAAPETKVVYLTDGIDAGRLRAALQAGADGYLTRDRSPEALAQGLRLVAMGEKVFPSDLALLLTQSTPLSSGNAMGPRGISTRETQILHYLQRGESNKQIAIRLNITEATVKVHLKSLLRKINCSNRTQAAIWAMNNGIDNELAVVGGNAAARA
jgi:two-component system nitrate/nitrite response regulator NarL